jgi:uridine phosphorylase
MIKDSELIINRDGSIFHLHLRPGDIAKKIVLVGDPGRVKMVSALFDKIEITRNNREFVSATGYYNGERLTVLSTGIGTDNIDIVVNELDALVNIDFKTRKINPVMEQLRFIRIGTSGGLQPELPLNSFIVTKKSIGFDGMLHFYEGLEEHCDTGFQDAFREFTEWDKNLPRPYVIDASDEMLNLFSGEEFTNGITISAPGFYGPQGREVRLPLAVPDLNRKIEEFRYKGFKITNFEMESSAIYGLSKLLGHKAITICALIANRVTREANENYKPVMERLVRLVLEKITSDKNQ